MSAETHPHQAVKGLFRQRFRMLLAALVLLFALYPFLEELVAGRLVSLFFTAILAAATYAISRNRRWLVVALVLAAGSLSGQWLSHFQNTAVVNVVARAFGCLFFLLTALTIIEHVLKGGTVTGDKICGAICAYLLLGLMWAFLFGLIEVVHPGSFLENGHLIAYGAGGVREFRLINSLIYYSIATQTTTTYGDILPITGPARAFSNLEAIAGQMYVAVLIARLVALQIVQAGKEHENPT
jgi:hypothetical protein